MAAPQAVVQAVQAAIVASAHLAAYEHVAAAAQACRRLGGLTSGRWRSVARDLDGVEDELQTAFANAAEVVTDRADKLGVRDDARTALRDAALALTRASLLAGGDDVGLGDEDEDDHEDDDEGGNGLDNGEH